MTTLSLYDSMPGMTQLATMKITVNAISTYVLYTIAYKFLVML